MVHSLPANDQICFVDCQKPVEECPCRQRFEVSDGIEALGEFFAFGGKTLIQVEDELGGKEE